MAELSRRGGGGAAPSKSSGDDWKSPPPAAAAGKKIVLKSADMKEDMQKEAVDCAIAAFEKHAVEKDIAEYIKKEFDKNHGPTWHCIVGRNFEMDSMGITQSIKGIEPLTDSNWSSWKMSVEILLGCMEFDFVLTEARPVITDNSTLTQTKALAKWDKVNRLTKMIIRFTISEALRGGIEETETAAELWAVLKTQFVGTNKFRQFGYLQKLMKHSFDGTGSVREHLSTLSRLVIGLRDAGLPFSNELMVHIGVISLPDSYDTFKMNYSAQEKQWDLNQLISFCVVEEERLKGGKKESANLNGKRPFQKSLCPKKANFKPKWHKQKNATLGKGTFEHHVKAQGIKELGCFHCGKSGHMVAYCRQNKEVKRRPKGLRSRRCPKPKSKSFLGNDELIHV